MINVSQAVLAKINNPIQLPSNQGDPQLSVYISTTGIDLHDISAHVQSATVNSRYDDYSYNVNLTVNKAAVNGNLDIPSIPLYPGAKLGMMVKFGSSSGTSDYITIASVIIDEISWPDGDTFTISGTNHISNGLTKCSMGETIELTGYSHEVGATIMDIAGVENYSITYGTYSWTYTYKPSDKCLDALEQMYPIFPKDGNDDPGFGILETPSGTVVFGYWRDRHEALPCENYIFNSMRDCWSMSTTKNSDKCYGRIFATGKAADGVDLTPVILDVDNFGTWNIPDSKIYFADFNGYTMQELLQDWAETVALELQYQGITDEITGPFRPQLTVGDIATFSDLNRQGVITSITHHMGIDGFSTDFSVDSGGVYSAVSGWTSSMKANGYNRRQKLADIVHEIAEEVTTETLNYHDPIAVMEQKYDEETGDPIEIVPERNKTTFEYYGWNRQQLLPDPEPEPEPEEEIESGS